MIFGKVHTWTKLWLCVTILTLLGSCRVTEPLPDADIVFQTMAKDRGPHSLGFVNADGNGLEYTEIRSVPGGIPVYPVWTSDAAFLVFHRSHAPFHSSGPLSAITAEGHLIQYDEDSFHGIVWVAPVSGSQQVIVAEPTCGGLPQNIPYRIRRLDLEKGVVAQTYITETPGFRVDVGTNALHGVNLIYVRRGRVDGNPVAEVVLLNTVTGKKTVLVTTGEVDLNTPAISPDGWRVAYTADDGIYVVSIEGGEPQRVVETCVVRRQPDGYARWDDWPPAPSWSPDGKWLVYHRCIRSCSEWCQDIEDYSIFKVDVKTSEETLLVEGGLNPYWHLDSVKTDKP